MTSRELLRRAASSKAAERLARRVDTWRGREVGLNVWDYLSTPEAAEQAGVGHTPLGAAFLSHTGRPVFKWTHYLAAYDEQFARYRDGFPLPDGTTRPLRMLEIGVLDGGSLQLWRTYFGPDAVITGIDVNPKVAELESVGLRVRIGSQDDPAFLRSVVAEMGGVDIVLDDGSHHAAHQRVSLTTLFPLLSEGGVYAVEDLHTSYWARWAGGYRRKGTFLEVVKGLIDDLHGWYHRQGDATGLRAAETIPKITIYDSIVFLEKARRQRPSSVRVGVPAVD